uniref:C-type lectin domain-containing protein n=1 Tax=Oryzias melastigma TaxID=30732 RepID=A0A3B3BGZ0_ORYME
WLRFQNKCFLFKGKKNEIQGNWSFARSWCREQGGELAIIDSQYENGRIANTELVSIHSRAELEFIRNLNYTKNHHIWIGLTRDRNFGWGWTDSTPLGYVNWAPGEPNAAFHPGEAAEENCVEMYPDGRWNDNNCMLQKVKRFINIRHLPSLI